MVEFLNHPLVDNWYSAIAINVFILYLSYKIIVYGGTGKFKKHHDKLLDFVLMRKKEDKVNSGAKFG